MQFSSNPMTRELLQVLEDKENGCIKSISLSEVELPAPTSFGQGKRCGEVMEEVAAGNGFDAEGHQVEGGLLAVVDAESPRLELAYEGDQRDFRGIRHTGEHRLCEKTPHSATT